MFEKIGRYAETVATSAGLSRRGFLGRLGNAGLAAVGLVGALLLVPGQAQASTGCEYSCPDGTVVRKNCPCGAPAIKHQGMTCTFAWKDCSY
jgi:hypothetical protein